MKEFEQIFKFCRHVAGSYQITAICLCGDYVFALSTEKKTIRVLLIIRGFQPRLSNYIKAFGKRSAVVFAVDEWIFERDVNKGLLGEALACRLIFPYVALINEEYLRKQEIKLKKRLVLELLENLVLDFPELSYELHIHPDYFMYETVLSRARLFPTMIYDLLGFMQKEVKEQNLESVRYGFSEALKELEKENIINFLGGYVKISNKFVENIKSRKVRFINLFRTAQRALFTYSLGIFPQILAFLAENRETFLKFQKIAEERTKIIHQIEDPQRYLYVPTASGLVSLASKMDIEAFARKVLSADKNVKIEIEEIGGILNDVYVIKTLADGKESKIIVKRFKDWSSFKWFPLTLWTVGTRTFAVLGRSRLEKECAINQLLYSKGFAVPKIHHVSHSERLIFMDYMEGVSLEKVIRKITNLKTVGEKNDDLNIISMVGEKFAEVHALDIALGDTKPENILITKNGEIYLLDFEQASRNGDKVWDIAEFLYYSGHYISPFVNVRLAELITKAFIKGYLNAGGNVEIIKKAGNPKYTKVFSVFTFPYIIFAISNICRKADKMK